MEGWPDSEQCEEWELDPTQAPVEVAIQLDGLKRLYSFVNGHAFWSNVGSQIMGELRNIQASQTQVASLNKLVFIK